MDLSIYIPEECKSPIREFRAFLQAMSYRYAQGNFRYGAPKKSKKYMTRMSKELKAYRKTGNVEHLMNIATYCALEMQQPEHKFQHFDNYAPSVTRSNDDDPTSGILH